VITREAARRRARDSGTLSGTSAEEERRRGRSCRCASGAQARSRPWPTPSCPRRGTSTGIPAAAMPTTPDTGGSLQIVTARQSRGTRYPPVCADVTSGPVVALAAQMWAFCAPATRRAGSPSCFL